MSKPKRLLFSIVLATSIVIGINVPAYRASAFVVADVQSASAYAQSRGITAAIAVMDLSNGQTWTAGPATSLMATESVVKTMIAARLLRTGQMHGAVESAAYRMITQSDDFAANSLYGLVGGDGLMSWIEATYNLPNLGAPPSSPGYWGNTKVTAVGLVALYAKFKADPGVGPWLLNAMRRATHFGSDGQDQYFGIPSATTGWAVKQGWGNDDGFFHAVFNSTGYVNGDRFAVAILAAGPSNTYGRYMMDVVTGIARRIMPGGRIALDLPPSLYLGAVGVKGSNARFAGWALDGDSRGQAVQVQVWLDNRLIWNHPTFTPRPDVNSAYHATGNHGFVLEFIAAEGPHQYCFIAVNAGAGGVNSRRCIRVVHHGAPFGYVAVGLRAGRPVVAGWTVDRDTPAVGPRVRLQEGQTVLGTYNVVYPRPDVDARWGVSGKHGFSVALSATPGEHTYCAFAANTGPAVDVERALGCVTVTVPPPTPVRPATKPTVTKPTVTEPVAKPTVTQPAATASRTPAVPSAPPSGAPVVEPGGQTGPGR